MKCVVLVLFLIQWFGRAAQDPRLAQMRSILEPMRKIDTFGDHRGATDELTTVKHLMRDWIESRLSDPAAPFDAGALSHQLSQELADAHLTCDDTPASKCPERSLLGFAGKVEIKRQSELLTIVAGVGIECGYDESVYAYRPDGKKWVRFLESEQNDYRDKHYSPQEIASVQISGTHTEEGGNPNQHLILTLGYEGWCASNWHDVYYRVWSVRSNRATPKLLLDESEWAFEAWDIEGAISSNDVLIEYLVSGREHSRQEIRHYNVDPADRITRIDPVALGPADFVEEWRTHPWIESSTWTDPAARKRLEASRPEKVWSTINYGKPTTHCRDHPDLWQVTINLGEPEQTTHFLVRWQPPYRFTMVDVSPFPWPNCRELDPVADEPRTLFRH